MTTNVDSALVQSHRFDQNDVDTIAVQKEEEWIKKRKVEKVTTKQIETRVKRQVVLQDGQVIDDSGPQVSTNTTEDTQTKREEHTEKVGGDEVDRPLPKGWVAIPGTIILKETNQKKYNTRDQIDERLETEQVHHLGRITHEQLEEAIENQKETGRALPWRRRDSSSGSFEWSGEHHHNRNYQLDLPASTKRIVHHSRKHKKIIDQEDTQEKSEEKDGQITTETTRHQHHEEVDDEELPDEEGVASDTSSLHETTKETNNNFTTVKDDDQVEYIAVPRGGKLSNGIKLGRGPHVFTETTHPSATKKEPTAAAAAAAGKGEDPTTAGERTDALTKKPLDLEEEEETRKFETSRWLERHYGSESSHSSTAQEDSSGGHHPHSPLKKMPSHISSGGINVTMLSKSPTSEPEEFERYDPAANLLKNSASGRYGGLDQVGVQRSSLYGGHSHWRPQAAPLKRATSFNHVSKPEYPWKIPDADETRHTSFTARRNFLSSMNTGNGSAKAAEVELSADAPNSFKPVHRRWPPLHPPEQKLEEDAEFIDPVRGTVIRLRPNDPPGYRSNGSILRSRSMLYPSKMSPGYSRPSAPEERMTPVDMKTTNEMNLLNASLQSVPERERSYMIDTSTPSFNSHSSPAKVIHSGSAVYGSKPANSGQPQPLKSARTLSTKTPPPRPAPPTSESITSSTNYATIRLGVNNGKGIRTSESFRHAKSPPMFADDHNEPPVRPIRRKPKRTGSSKTDSGTQTIRNEMIHTLDRPKPMKKYYLGQDPFNGDSLSSSHSPKSSASVAHQPPEAAARHSHKPLSKPELQVSRNSFINPIQSYTTARRQPEAFRNSYTTPRQPEASQNAVTAPRQPEVFRNSQTLPRQPEVSAKVVVHPIREESKDPCGSNESGMGQKDRLRSSLSTAVGRSQSFHVDTKPTVRQMRPQLHFKLSGSSFRNPESNGMGSHPLYKSTSHLNRMNSSSGMLKSPGIVTSISKSQLDLNKSSQNERFRPDVSTFYTLPRKRVDKVEVKSTQRPPSPPLTPPPPPPPVADFNPNADAEFFNFPPPPPSPPTPPMSLADAARGETFSSIHRRKMEAAKQAQSVSPTKTELSPVSFHSSMRSSYRETHPSDSGDTTNGNDEVDNGVGEAPENKSFKERIALLESAGIHYANPALILPRVVSGKAKNGPPAPPKNFSSAMVHPTQLNGSPPTSIHRQDNNGEGIEKRQKFLEGLLNTAPELFRHIHGDENLQGHGVNRSDVIDGKVSRRLPKTPSPLNSPPPPLIAAPPLNPSAPHVFTYSNAPLNRTYTSTPVLNLGSPVSPPPHASLVRNTQFLNSPFGSQYDLALRRGSLNSNASNNRSTSNLIPLVKIPAPVDYSESSRIRSSNDPDVRSHNESDSLRSYSKRTTPLPDGFSSETKQSNEQTTMSRSEFTQERQSPNRSSASPNSFAHIRPQQYGGVIIKLGGRNDP